LGVCSELADIVSVTRPSLENKVGEPGLPAHVLQKRDPEATLRGITRQALIKVRLFDRLELFEAKPLRAFLTNNGSI